jgi:hypothetical protein
MEVAHGGLITSGARGLTAGDARLKIGSLCESMAIHDPRTIKEKQ